MEGTSLLCCGEHALAEAATNVAGSRPCAAGGGLIRRSGTRRTATLPLVPAGDPGEAPTQLLFGILRPPVAPALRSGLSARSGLRPGCRHLCSLRDRYRGRLQSSEAQPRPAARRGPRDVGVAVNPCPAVPMGRRSHPARGGGRRTMRSGQPTHALPAVPPRGDGRLAASPASRFGEDARTRGCRGLAASATQVNGCRAACRERFGRLPCRSSSVR